MGLPAVDTHPDFRKSLLHVQTVKIDLQDGAGF